MSLRYALLGLLDAEPSSGYDLARQFAEGIGSYAWSAKHSQIYPELKKLTDEGLIEITETGARGRKTYAVTAVGRDELRQWLLAEPSGGGGVRNEFVLRLFLLSSLDRDEAAGILAGTLHFAEARVELLEGEFVSAARASGTESGGGPGMAAQFGILSYRALADWARWALGSIQDDPSFDPRPSTVPLVM